jgi:DNA-binding MurR/RpiR family transcriptional regulator
LDEGDQAEPDSPARLLSQYCAANIIALEHLQEGIDSGDLDKALGLIRSARHIYIAGQRRSLPIATYLSYTLTHVDRPTHFLDGSGGMLNEQVSAMTCDDLLIAISFHPYSDETVAVAELAHGKGIPCIAFTDSSISPLVKYGSVYFNVHDAEVHSFRSLAASMILAQTLATSPAFSRC